jgi:hypothetical protein
VVTHQGHPPVVVLREPSAAGEVVLRRRGAVRELLLDGHPAMDTLETSTEEALAAAALTTCASPRRVLVGGLGLGVTTRAVLADPRVERVDVVELAEPLVAAARAGTVPELAGLEADPRCRLTVADVADVLLPPGPLPPWDVVLLDVDNGPGFLLREQNAPLYAVPALAAARSRLAPGGVLVVWSSHAAPALLAALTEAAAPGDTVDERLVAVRREGRAFEYALYVLRRAGRPATAGGHLGSAGRQQLVDGRVVVAEPLDGIRLERLRVRSEVVHVDPADPEVPQLAGPGRARPLDEPVVEGEDLRLPVGERDRVGALRELRGARRGRPALDE